LVHYHSWIGLHVLVPYRRTTVERMSPKWFY
jgi:hypothetical protein